VVQLILEKFTYDIMELRTYMGV